MIKVDKNLVEIESEAGYIVLTELAGLIEVLREKFSEDTINAAVRVGFSTYNEYRDEILTGEERQ